MARYVLPLAPALFADEDPMPLYALKMLGILLDVNSAWVSALASLGMARRWGSQGKLMGCLGSRVEQSGGSLLHCNGASARMGLHLLFSAVPSHCASRPSSLLCCRFFEQLSIEHPHNNVHNIRLCRLVAQSGVLLPAQLLELRVADRVRAGRGKQRLGLKNQAGCAGGAQCLESRCQARRCLMCSKECLLNP